MRIGFDAKRLFNNFTGLGNYSRFVVKALLDHYPQNHYTLYSPKVKDHPDTQYFRVNPKLLVRTPPKWVKGSGFGSFWRSVNLGNIAFRDGIDVFHGLSNELPVTKPTGLKTVVTIHDLIFIRYPELYHKIDATIYKRKLVRACQTADKIITISQQTASDLKEFLQVEEDRIQVVYQGCNDLFKARSSSEQIARVRTKYGLPENYILNVGTLEPRKNALTLLKAVALLDSGNSVVLVGRQTSYQQQLDDYVRSNRLESRVHFVHEASIEDLPSIYQGANVFVYPSRFEGFGIPIVEAIHSGLPVVAATGSCLEEAGGPAGVYVHPDDEHGMASAISNFLNNQKLKIEAVDKSKEYVKRFEPAHIADDLIGVYRSVMA